MIELIISKGCDPCKKQLEIIEKNFAPKEFSIIAVESEEFNKYADKELVEAVPFIVIKEGNGNIKYAGKGIHEAGQIRKLLKPVKAYNNTKRIKI